MCGWGGVREGVVVCVKRKVVIKVLCLPHGKSIHS